MSNKRNRNQRAKDVRKAAVLDPSVRGDAPNNGGSSFSSIGAPGTAIYGGYVLNKEKDARLTGQERFVTYSDMLANTSIVGAGVRYFVDLVAKATWGVEPADESAEAEKLAETVEDMMNDMTTPFHKVVKRACMYTFWGYSIQEWTAKRRDDGQVGFMDIEPRAQMTIERWDTDISGTVLGVVQRNPQDQSEIYLPISKCIYLVDNTLNDSPEGMGLFRSVVKAAEKLSRYELLEAWGFDTDLRGIPIVRGPFTQLEQMVNNKQLTVAQANALKQPMLDFLESHNKNPELGMMLDSMTYQTTDERATPSPVKQWDVELLKGDPNGQEEVHIAIQRVNREIARVLGVEQLLLGENGGSNALARDKTAQFGLIVDSCLKELKETFEKDFLDPLWLLNGWDPKLKPTFKIEKIQYRDIEEVVGALEKLSRAGFVMDQNDPAGNEVRALVGLSDRPEQEEVDLALGMEALKDPLAPEPKPAPEKEKDDVPDDKEDEKTEKLITRVLKRMFSK
tara:strand:- start:3722 stop:5245 length:1524 start_codon:yes stop_codon:yes gene_type:complete